MEHDANPDVGLNSQVSQATSGLNLHSRCSSSCPRLKSVTTSLPPPPNSPVRSNKEWWWVAALWSRRRRCVAGKLEFLQGDLQLSHTLLWIPHRCSGWHCLCPSLFALWEHSYKRMLVHTSIQGMDIFSNKYPHINKNKGNQVKKNIYIDNSNNNNASLFLLWFLCFTSPLSGYSATHLVAKTHAFHNLSPLPFLEWRIAGNHLETVWFEAV